MWPSVPPLEVSKSFPKLCNSFCLVRLFAIRRFTSRIAILLVEIKFPPTPFEVWRLRSNPSLGMIGVQLVSAHWLWCDSASLLCCIEMCGCHSTLVVYSADVPYGCYHFVRTFAHIHCSLLVVLLWITSVGSEAQFVPSVPDLLVVGVGSVAQCTRFRETWLCHS